VTPTRMRATFDLPNQAGLGKDCTECARKLRAKMADLPGVLDAECDAQGVMWVDYDPSRVTERDLDAAMRRFGAELAGHCVHGFWRVMGLD
jgi:hypothetical protein